MIIYDLKTMQECEIDSETVVALGTFDGCHAGHMSVIRSAYLKAKSLKIKSVVYTFDKIPKSSSDSEIKSILTIDEKISRISEYFEIFLDRMMLCRRAAGYFGMQFEVNINGSTVM